MGIHTYILVLELVKINDSLETIGIDVVVSKSVFVIEIQYLHLQSNIAYSYYRCAMVEIYLRRGNVEHGKYKTVLQVMTHCEL